MKNLLTIYRNTCFSEERIVCGSAIAKSFVEFMIFNLEHMAKEEVLINEALWKHYTDEQIIELNQKLVASIPEEELALASKWMLRGINNYDAVNWLRSIKQSAPFFVFDALINVAEKELPADRFNAIQESLNSNVVIA
jgi:hypothetical protein